MKRTLIKLGLVAISAAFLASCGTTKSAETEPYFDLRGVVLCWDDISHPETIDWIAKMKENGLNTISLCGKDYTSQEYLDFKQYCIDEGLDFEYEDHGMTWLLPRELYDTNPEYFRMTPEGQRVKDGNGCPSNPEALKVIHENAKLYAETVRRPTNHRYYFWLFDGGDICHCEKCEGLSASDQGLMFENEVIKALREVDPEAQLAHLAYHSTTPAPVKVKPEEGIFLEFAPFYRRWDKPLSDRDAIRKGLPYGWNHGDYLDMLDDNIKVFGAENSQVLEYWMDVSLVSDWKKPQKQLFFHNDVFQDDLETYAEKGIKNITCYAIYCDDYYVNTFKDVSFIDEYGQGLLNYREEPAFEIGRKESGFDGFHAPWDGLDDDTAFRCRSDRKNFYFEFIVNDSTITLKDEVKCEADVEPEDRIEIFFCPTKQMKRYYVAEVDALGRVLDYSCDFYRKMDYGWNFRTLECKGELTDTGYILRGKVSKAELRELGCDLEGGFYTALTRDDFRPDGSVNWYSVKPTADLSPDFQKPEIVFPAKMK